MEKKYCILPKIYKPSGSENGQWFVFYSIRDDYSGKLKRFRVYEGFAACKSVEEKEQNARKLKNRLTEKLKRGWSPFNDKSVIFENTSALPGVERKPGRPPKKTISTYSAQFLLEKETKRSKGTWQKYQSELRIFDKWLEIKNLDKVDISYFNKENAFEFINYLADKRNLSGKTKNNYLLTLAQLWKFVEKQRKMLENPWLEIDKFQEYITPQRPLNQATISILKKHLEKNDPQLWLVAQFMYYCFIRPKELRFLKIKHLELYEGKVSLNSDITKAGKPRVVDVDLGFLGRLFEDYKLNSYDPELYVFTKKGEPGPVPVSKNYFWKQFDKARKQLSLPRHYKFYGFKHTGAVVALRNGANIKEIQHQMGHSSIAITDEYLKSMVGYESEFFKKKMPTI